MDPVAKRLYECLAEALERRGHPEYLPVTVAEIHEDLVPYREVRSELDVHLNADYEHALLRLLAGAGDLLVLEPEEARAELKREAEAPYPDVGLFRKFSGSQVWVRRLAQSDRPVRLHDEAENRAEAEPERDPEAGRDPQAGRDPEARPEEEPEAGPEEPGAAPPVRLHRDEPPVRRGATQPASCIACAEPLPLGRSVRFCPHCGRDQRLRHCPRCAAVLEQGWRYCVACGRETGPR